MNYCCWWCSLITNWLVLFYGRSWWIAVRQWLSLATLFFKLAFDGLWSWVGILGKTLFSSIWWLLWLLLIVMLLLLLLWLIMFRFEVETNWRQVHLFVRDWRQWDRNFQSVRRSLVWRLCHRDRRIHVFIWDDFRFFWIFATNRLETRVWISFRVITFFISISARQEIFRYRMCVTECKMKWDLWSENRFIEWCRLWVVFHWGNRSSAKCHLWRMRHGRQLIRLHGWRCSRWHWWWHRWGRHRRMWNIGHRRMWMRNIGHLRGWHWRWSRDHVTRKGRHGYSWKRVRHLVHRVEWRSGRKVVTLWVTWWRLECIVRKSICRTIC